MRLQAELQRIAERAPAVDVPDDTWARARRARRRGLTAAVAAAAGVVALVVGTVTWLPDRTQPAVADTQSFGVPDRLYNVPADLVSQREDGGWASDAVTDDVTVVGVGATAWVDDGLPVVVDAARGDYHLLDLPDFLGNSWRSSVENTPAIALSPDGRRLAYAYAVLGPEADEQPVPSGIRVVDLATGAVREIPVPGEEGIAISRIEWSPNGSWLAFAGMQQSYWTQDSMGVSEYLDDAGPVLGRVGPGRDRAELRKVANDAAPMSVDDQGTVQWRGGRLRLWGTGPGDREALDALGRLPDRRWLMRTGTNDNDVLSVRNPRTGRRTVLVDVYGIDGSLTVATDLMTPGRLTVDRPPPRWDSSSSFGVGTGAALVATVLAAVLAGWLLLRRPGALSRRFRSVES